MRRVRVALAFAASVHEAETCWYDTTRWPAWVDELARIVEVAGDWPRAGASVTWESGPAGRGHVIERVVAYQPLGGQTLDVHDDSIQGQQRVTFTPADGSVEVVLGLDYEISERSIFTPLIDVLFIRRAMERSLRTTLSGFGVELAARRSQGAD
jgi:Polyketide cyclase / dehydrase and lipid transport